MDAGQFRLFAEIEPDRGAGLADGFAHARRADAVSLFRDFEEIGLDHRVVGDGWLGAGEKGVCRFLAFGDLGLLKRLRPAVAAAVR